MHSLRITLSKISMLEYALLHRRTEAAHSWRSVHFPSEEPWADTKAILVGEGEPVFSIRTSACSQL